MRAPIMYSTGGRRLSVGRLPSVFPLPFPARFVCPSFDCCSFYLFLRSCTPGWLLI